MFPGPDMLNDFFLKIPLDDLKIHFGFAYFTKEVFDEDLVPYQLKNSSLKRQNDFLLGRKAASFALKSLNPKIENYVGMGSKGLPIWPDGITGSISHCEGLAIAAVASKKHMRSIGIDIELRSSEPMLSDIAHMILSPIERDETLDPTSLLMKFSAKESVYKCIFPIIKKFIDFNECTIDDKKNGYFTPRISNEVLTKTDLDVMGLYRIGPEHIITLSWIGQKQPLGIEFFPCDI